MIYSLIWLHSIESVALDGSITPEDVPVFFFGVGEFHFVGFGHSSNYRVVAVVDVYVQASLLVFRLFLLFLCFHLFCWLLWHLASTFFLLNLSILLFHLLFFLLLVWIVLFIFWWVIVCVRQALAAGTATCILVFRSKAVFLLILNFVFLILCFHAFGLFFHFLVIS